MAVEKTEEAQLARALADVALDSFRLFNWHYWETHVYSECLKEFNSFEDQVFDALAYYAWNLYDKEDLENKLFVDDIYDECETIWGSIGSDKGKLDPSLLDIRKLKKVREQDLCNLLWMSYSGFFERKEFSDFKTHINLLPSMKGFYYNKDFEIYVTKARNIMRAHDDLNGKVMLKNQLRIEAAESKCFCVSDALFWQSWKLIDLEALEATTPCPKYFEALVENVFRSLYSLAGRRAQRLDKCQMLVTYFLPKKIYGSWDDEAVKVIKMADLKRRSEERRFIGTDHLIFCLHQMLFSEIPCQTIRNYVRISPFRVWGWPFDQWFRDTGVQHSDTIYHLYQKAYDIATKLGDQTIGLEHLYAAITSGNVDDEDLWRFFVKDARIAKAKRKVTSKVEDVPHPNPWNDVIANLPGNPNIAKGFTEREIDAADILPAVKFMTGKKNTNFLDAVTNFFNKVDEHRGMAKEEILMSLMLSVHGPSISHHLSRVLSSSAFIQK